MKFGIYLLREENHYFLEGNVRHFPAGFDEAFYDVTKKGKIQVHYINATNLTLRNMRVMIAA